MPITPEDRARETIARPLTDAGWLIQSHDQINTAASPSSFRYFAIDLAGGSECPLY
jgi:hypothetical protein